MEPFARIGNNLSADFVNTVVSFDHDGGTLRSAGDVVDFLTTTGAIEKGDTERLRGQLAKSAVAARFLATALELRAAVTAALTAIERHEPFAGDSLALINAILAKDTGFEQLALRDGALRVERRRTKDDPAAALVPIARDVARLLATPGAPVRRRRWCEMAICGNRAKASAFAKRHAAR
jgi:predicted RNA-binding Zn ribbon-like protein